MTNEYESAMWEFECKAERLAIELNISKIEARELIIEGLQNDI